MKGHLRKRGDTWSIVIDVPDNDKKRKRKWHTFKGNKREAEAEMARLINEVNNGEYVDATKETVGKYLERWLDHVEKRVARRTFERYAEIVRKQLVGALGSTNIARLTPVQIEDAYRRWKTTGRRRGKGTGLSPQTILHHHRVLHEALAQAVRWRIIRRNPCEAVETPRRARTEMRVLNEAEMANLLAAASGTRLAVPIAIALTTGARRGELLALRWSDFDAESGTLVIRRAVEIQRTPERSLEYKTPKSGKSRPIDLSAGDVDTLRKHRAVQNESKMLNRMVYQDNDLIFPREDGSVWDPDLFTKAFGRIVTRAKMGHVRLHDLRHACASWLLKSGVHAKVVSERLGHSTIAITMDLYSHVMPGIQQAASESLDAMLKRAIAKRDAS